MNIDIIKDKLQIKYYSSLNTTLNKSNRDIDWLKNYINILNNPEVQLKQDNKNIIDLKENNTNNLYTKSWTKLNIIHKNIKIKEFVNNINCINENEKNILKDELINLLKSKVLTKKDTIVYDEENGKIKSIINLQYKDGKYFYLME